jgi:hypothetical protein
MPKMGLVLQGGEVKRPWGPLGLPASSLHGRFAVSRSGVLPPPFGSGCRPGSRSPVPASAGKWLHQCCFVIDGDVGECGFGHAEFLARTSGGRCANRSVGSYDGTVDHHLRIFPFRAGIDHVGLDGLIGCSLQPFASPDSIGQQPRQQFHQGQVGAAAEADRGERGALRPILSQRRKIGSGENRRDERRIRSPNVLRNCSVLNAREANQSVMLSSGVRNVATGSLCPGPLLGEDRRAGSRRWGRG